MTQIFYSDFIRAKFKHMLLTLKALCLGEFRQHDFGNKWVERIKTNSLNIIEMKVLKQLWKHKFSGNMQKVQGLNV